MGPCATHSECDLRISELERRLHAIEEAYKEQGKMLTDIAVKLAGLGGKLWGAMLAGSILAAAIAMIVQRSLH